MIFKNNIRPGSTYQNGRVYVVFLGSTYQPPIDSRPQLRPAAELLVLYEYVLDSRTKAVEYE